VDQLNCFLQQFEVSFTQTCSILIATKNAGVDLDLTYFGPDNRFSLLVEAVKAGRVTEESLRESAKRLFLTRMKLGEFDPPSMNPFSDITLDGEFVNVEAWLVDFHWMCFV